MSARDRTSSFEPLQILRRNELTPSGEWTGYTHEYWLESGSLNANLADGAPTRGQLKAAALYGTVDL